MISRNILHRVQKEARGFALIITLIFVSVILALGASLLDVAYKQVLLSSGSRQSQYAFYNADSALECALYFDQKNGVFRYDYPGTTADANVVCNGIAVTYPSTPSQSGGVRTTVFQTPCAAGGVSATVTVLKQVSGVTDMYANGYNTCNTSAANSIERGLKVHY